MFYENDLPVDPAVVRERFLASAFNAGVPSANAERIWDLAISGDTDWRELVEETTGVEIRVGFGDKD